MVYTYLVKPGLVPLETVVNALTVNPRRRFGLPMGEDFTVWDLEARYTIDPAQFLSQAGPLPSPGWRSSASVCSRSATEKPSGRQKGVKMHQQLCRVLQNAALTDAVWQMRLEADTASITAPGQFVELKLPGFYLRRPISICDWDGESLTLLYKWWATAPTP